MEPLIHLNYPINKDILLLESDKARETAKPWELAEDKKKNEKSWQGIHNYTINEWLVSHYTSDYIDNIMKELNIKGKPRFYYLQPNYQLRPHKDYGTQCAVNIILSGSTPINIEGKDYYYSQALINLQKEHSIKTDNTERIILKFSIPDKSFEEIAKEIKYVVSS